MLAAHYESVPTAPATTTANTAETSPPAPKVPETKDTAPTTPQAQGNEDAKAALSRLGSVASVKILIATCSKIEGGAFKVEVHGEVTAPDESFFAAVATPFQINSGNRPTRLTLSCESWGDFSYNLLCQHSQTEPSQTEWTLRGVLYSQATTGPNMVMGTLRKGRPGEANSPVLASDVYNNLVCR